MRFWMQPMPTCGSSSRIIGHMACMAQLIGSKQSGYRTECPLVKMDNFYLHTSARSQAVAMENGNDNG